MFIKFYGAKHRKPLSPDWIEATVKRPSILNSFQKPSKRSVIFKSNQHFQAQKLQLIRQKSFFPCYLEEQHSFQSTSPCLEVLSAIFNSNIIFIIVFAKS